MFSSYLKAAVRNLLQNKLYTFVNLAGLAIGMACFILTAIWVNNEISYDKHFKNHNRIFRLAGDLITEKNHNYTAYCYRTLPRLIRYNYEGVDAVTGIYKVISLVAHQTNRVYEENTYYADTGFFNVFAFKFVKGSASGFCRERNTAVITDNKAKQLFGDKNPVGETIYVLNAKGHDYNTKSNDTSVAFKITGVIRNNPQSSHFHPEVILSKSKPKYMFEYVYVLLKPGFTAPMFKNYVWRDLYNRHLKKIFFDDGQNYDISLQPLTDLHLNSRFLYELEPPGNFSNVLILSIIATLVLLIACANYLNLGISSSIKRTSEIGVRKTLGASRKQVMFQFLAEACMLVLLALIIALALAEFTLPIVEKIAEKKFTIRLLQNHFTPFVIFALLVVTLLSAAYPALYASAFSPSRALKQERKGGFLVLNIRKLLVVLQFVMSITVMVAAIVTSRQLDYLKKQELGFRQEQVVLIPIHNPVMQKQTVALKKELLKCRYIKKASASVTIPGTGMIHLHNRFKGDSAWQSYVIATLCVDEDYLDVMGIKLLEGRNFTTKMFDQKDSLVFCIINQSAQNMFGWKHVPGKKMSTYYDSSTVRLGECIGLVKDFHTNSLRDAIEPTVLRLGYARTPGYQWLSILLDSAGQDIALKHAQKTFEHLSQGYPFEYRFMNEAFNQQYREEETQELLIKLFACISICISCIGLLGLTSYTTLLRAKEIGIRRISGATKFQIVRMLYTDFLKYIFISFLIATPLGYYFMNSWLQNFAYRIAIDLSVFAGAAMVTLFITLLTVSYHTLKIAGRDLATVLKHD